MASTAGSTDRNLIRRVAIVCALLSASLSIAGCGGSDTSPSPTALRLTSVSPGAGSTVGGTTVTLAGANFSGVPVVTIGGAPATNVTVMSASTITATAPAHGSGGADVVVTLNGQTASLTSAFTYVSNTPPVVTSMAVHGSKPREPAQFADLDEPVTVSATASDAETPASQLTYAWSSDVGTFSGSGPTVTWTAPHDAATPRIVTLTVTVTESFLATSSSGLPVAGENTTRGTTDVKLHNSPKEVGDLAVDFLDAFSKQLDPDFVVRNFTSSCPQAAAERSDVVADQADVTITSYKLGTATTTVPFTGRCPFRSQAGDACAQVPAEWHSLIKSAKYHSEFQPYIGMTQTVIGTDQVTAFFENNQWKLCASDWNQTSSTITSLSGVQFHTAIPFKR